MLQGLSSIVDGGDHVGCGYSTQSNISKWPTVARDLPITTLFTLILKATTALLVIDPRTWSILSGVILVLLGIAGAFPDLWERLSATLSLQGRSDARLRAARARGGLAGDILTGAALGPVFSSCSPLYAYVVVTVGVADVPGGCAIEVVLPRD